jgi:hypothetical protein
MPNPAPRANVWWLGLNFALVIFISAFLLFQVQPLISKFILPWFGGGPAVWTACMLFFQIVLFAGYAYAHLSVKWLSTTRQGIVHAILLVAALAVTIPSVAPSSSWKPAGSEIFRSVFHRSSVASVVRAIVPGPLALPFVLIVEHRLALGASDLSIFG